MRSIWALCLLAGSLSGQVGLTVDKQELNFSVTTGGMSEPQHLMLTATSATTLAVNTSLTPGWLSVLCEQVPCNATPNASLVVRVNATNLGEGTYQGTFGVRVNGLPASEITVQVNLTVGGESLLSADPPSLAFTAVQGAATGFPALIPVQVHSSGATLDYTVQTLVGWLQISAPGGTSGSGGFAVGVKPAGLIPGTYTTNILIQSTTTIDAFQISVSLKVSANEQLSLTPSTPAPFLFQIGGDPPASQSLTLDSSGGAVAYTVTENPQVSWLAVSPLSGSAGSPAATLTLTASPLGLAAGTYTTDLIITPANGTPLDPVPVSLIVSTRPILQVTPRQLSFSAPLGGAPPGQQQIQVTTVGTGNPVGFLVSSSQPWLSFNTGGVTTDTMTVSVNPAGLAIGQHTGVLTLQPTNGDTYTREVAVRLTVLDLPQLTAAPGAVLFTHQTSTTPPQTQTVELRSLGGMANLSLTSSTFNCGSAWLNATLDKVTTPAVLRVSVTTAGLLPGYCQGRVTVSYSSGSGAAETTGVLEVPVGLAVSNESALQVSVPQGFGVIAVRQGAVAATHSLTLTSSDLASPVNFTVATSSAGGPWLVASTGSGTTPQNVEIRYQTAGLAPGTYTGEVTIGSNSLPVEAVVIPVLLRVLPNIQVTVAPNYLTFSHPQGSAPPAGKQIVLTSSSEGATFTATVLQDSGDWLGLDRTSGAASGSILATVRPNTLPQNSYTARVRLEFQNAISAPVDVTIILNVTAPRSIAGSVASLDFVHALGDTAPPAQTFNITSVPAGIEFAAVATSNGWLSVSAAEGTAPRQLSASVNPAGLGIGNYQGAITITSAGVSNSPITITVRLAVNGPPAPRPTTVTNNASNVAGVIAPGELITIKGTFLGPLLPAEGSLFTVTADNRVSSTLAGVRVLFDGIAGTPIYVSQTQINVIVPYEVAGRVSVTIEIEYLGSTSAGIVVRISDAAPGIYTLDSTGQGQAAAINSNGTFNGPPGSAGTPAGAATSIVVYGTGGGQTNPPSQTGTVTRTDTLLRLPGTVTATIGGLPATVEFAGAAPGLVTGVIQFNLKPHPNAHGNNLPVILTIHGVSSPVGPTLAIQ